jgi:uncharacterized membrane protein
VSAAGVALALMALPAVLPGAAHPADVLGRLVFAPVCHQDAERSFAGVGGAFAVCARCHGLYAGGFLGALLGAVFASWARRPARVLLAVAIAPTVLQWVSVRLGAPDPSNLVRFALALPAGIACGWFLAAGAGDLGASVAARFRTPRPASPPASAAPRT